MIFGFARNLLLTLGLLTGLSASDIAGADVTHSPWGLGMLMHERAEILSDRAAFQETRILQMMRNPLEVSGELVYRAPDYLRKTVVQPEFEEMEVVGQRLYLGDRESRRRLHIDQHPALTGMVAAIRGTLSGDLVSLENHFEHDFNGTQSAWRLDLTPRSIEVAEYIRAVTIEGEGSRLLRVETRYANGDTSLMQMQSME